MGLPSSFTQHGYTCLTSCHKFPPSWRTIVGIYDQTCISFQLWCYHLFKPPYQYVMHIDTGDYRRTDRTLSTSFFGFFKFIVVHNPCLQHPSDKTDNFFANASVNNLFPDNNEYNSYPCTHSSE